VEKIVEKRVDVPIEKVVKTIAQNFTSYLSIPSSVSRPYIESWISQVVYRDAPLAEEPEEPARSSGIFLTISFLYQYMTSHLWSDSDFDACVMHQDTSLEWQHQGNQVSLYYL
jgi:hypothetical protein